MMEKRERKPVLSDYEMDWGGAGYDTPEEDLGIFMQTKFLFQNFNLKLNPNEKKAILFDCGMIFQQ
jgi:hypothetical protein